MSLIKKKKTCSPSLAFGRRLNYGLNLIWREGGSRSLLTERSLINLTWLAGSHKVLVWAPSYLPSTRVRCLTIWNLICHPFTPIRTIHSYIYISFNPVDNTSEADAVIVIENCIRDVRAWMRDDKLMLNDDKTEFLIIGTERQLSRVSRWQDQDRLSWGIARLFSAQFGRLVRFSSRHVDSCD